MPPAQNWFENGPPDLAKLMVFGLGHCTACRAGETEGSGGCICPKYLADTLNQSGGTDSAPYLLCAPLIFQIFHRYCHVIHSTTRRIVNIYFPLVNVQYMNTIRWLKDRQHWIQNVVYPIFNMNLQRKRIDLLKIT